MVFEFEDAWLAGAALQALAGAGIAAAFSLDAGKGHSLLVHRLRVGDESAALAAAVLGEHGLLRHAGKGDADGGNTSVRQLTST